MQIVCHGRDVLTVLPTRLAKSTIYQLIPKVLFRLGRTANTTSKTIAELLFFVGLQSGTVPSPSSASETNPLRTKHEDVFYKINHIFVGRTVQHCMLIHAVRALCNSVPPTKQLPVIVFGLFFSGEGIADILTDIYFNWGAADE